MKKIKLIVAAVAMLSLVSSSAVYADGFGPGEGLYIGGFAGVGTGIVQATVTSRTGGDHEGGTFDMADGGIGLFGIEGGGWLGYGYKMGDFYLGWDMDFAGAGPEFRLTSSIGIDMKHLAANEVTTDVTAERQWRGGGAGRIGYYLNADTLFAFKGGLHAEEFEIADGMGNNEEVYAGGYQLGLSLESRIAAIDPNLSVRLEAVYDDYISAPVSAVGGDAPGKADIEVTGMGTQMRAGLQYSFFDVSSLF